MLRRPIRCVKNLGARPQWSGRFAVPLLIILNSSECVVCVQIKMAVPTAISDHRSSRPLIKTMISIGNQIGIDRTTVSKILKRVISTDPYPHGLPVKRHDDGEQEQCNAGDAIQKPPCKAQHDQSSDDGFNRQFPGPRVHPLHDGGPTGPD